MEYEDSPLSTKSDSTSPTTGQNLNPWPEKPAAKTTFCPMRVHINHEMMIRSHCVETNGMLHRIEVYSRQMRFEKLVQSFEVTRMASTINLDRIQNWFTSRVFGNFDCRSIKTRKTIERAVRQFEEVCRTAH